MVAMVSHVPMIDVIDSCVRSLRRFGAILWFARVRKATHNASKHLGRLVAVDTPCGSRGGAGGVIIVAQEVLRSGIRGGAGGVVVGSSTQAGVT